MAGGSDTPAPDSYIFLALLGIPFLNHLLKDRSSLTQALIRKLAHESRQRSEARGQRSGLSTQDSKFRTPAAEPANHEGHGGQHPPLTKTRGGSEMFRVLKYVAATAILAALLALPFLISTASITNQVSVIVELRDEPAAVYKARTEKAGGTVSQDQLMAYRNQLAAKQADFLKALSANSISAAVVSR